MLKAAKAFLSDPHRITLFHGGTGNGKTIILQAVVNESTRRHIAAVYITYADLLDHIRAGFNPNKKINSDDAQVRFEKFIHVPVLALDELDKAYNATDWMLEKTTQLIDHRYRSGLAGRTGTLIAMNNHPDMLPIDIYSRIMDGRNTRINNNDPDMRSLLK